MQSPSSTSTNSPSLPDPIQLNQDEDNNTSAEAGGIVRGAARTATTMSRRAVIGRLPKAPPKPPRIIIPKGKAPMPRIMPKKVPIKHVARVSDRISTGFDVYDSVTSSSSSGGTNSSNEAHAMKARWRLLSQRILSFSGTLVKNTIMGAAVFETYEQIIQYFDRTIANNHDNTSNGTDAFERTSISHHFAAGTVAGSLHSILHMTFQSADYIYSQKNQVQLQQQRSLQPFNFLPANFSTSFYSLSSWGICHTIHHAVAHALLFSTYEGTKRMLFGNASVHLRAVSPYRQEQLSTDTHTYTHMSSTMVDDQDYKEHAIYDILLVALAGGIAGQIQHVTSHYTESWLRVGDDHSIRLHWEEKKRMFANMKFRVAGPCIRSTLMAFPPSAIGFVAFEFGKGLMES